MIIKVQRLLNISMVLLSWLTLPLLGIRNIKRFLPASLLILLVEILHARYGKKHRWWVFYNKTKSPFFGELPFQIGPFLAVSLWFLKWTYGNFMQFILLNGISTANFTFLFTYFAKKFRYYKLVRINSFQFFLYFFSKAFLLYWFQYLFELKRARNFNNDGEECTESNGSISRKSE